MKKWLRHIVMVVLLLMVGGQGAWADVTYKILTLPITTQQRELSDTKNKASEMGATISTFRNGVRVEALKCTSSTTTVGLPDEFKSPLATNYKYWTTATKIDGDTWQKLYGYNSTTYEIYSRVSGEISEGSTVDKNATIYVTYEYVGPNDILDLTGTKQYNVMMESSDSKQRFWTFNGGWGNRSTSYYATDIVSEGVENLASDEFVAMEQYKDGNNTTQWHCKGRLYHFIFKFDNESAVASNPDPYNIRVCSAYDKDGVILNEEKGVGGEVWKYMRGSSVFFRRDALNQSWLASDINIQWQDTGTSEAPVGVEVPGYYRGADSKGKHSEFDPLINSFALLNHPSGTEGTYSLMATKVNCSGSANFQPTKNKEYLYWCGNDAKNLPGWYKPSNKANSDKITFYEVKTYTFRVTTPSGTVLSATRQWSDYASESEISTDHIPTILKRKYCDYVGFYSDAALTNKITKYSEATDGHIYVKYEVSEDIPFTEVAASDTTWYELTNAEASTEAKKITYSGSVFQNTGVSGTYTKNGMYAFIGDPYELKVIHRQTTWDNTANRYIGAASDGDNLGINASADDGYVWELPYDDTEGSFLLRQFNTASTTAEYWYWDADADNQTVAKSSSDSTRVKLLELPKYTYYYNIVDKAGNIAVKASVTQTIFSPLKYSSIPEIIRSPYLYGETLTFYSTLSAEGNRSNLSGALTETPSAASDIYVSYTTTNLSSRAIKLDGNQEFYVKVNDTYIYYDSSSSSIKSASAVPAGTEDEKPYLWILCGSDPYAMIIKNKSSGTYVKAASWTDNATLSFVEKASASKFVTKSSTESGAYEVMAATGSGTDASTTYYNIGRTAENTVVMVSNSSYAHGSDIIKFNLEGSVTYTYKLIDKNDHVLLVAESKAPDLVLPSSLQSPLVDTYHYWKSSSITISGSTYTVNGGASEITNVTETESDHLIYVTYTTSDLVKYNDPSAQYLIKFANGSNYYLEDGQDKLTTEPKQAAYIYANGDSHLNIYYQELYDEQMGGGTSSRPRWAWFLESEHSDPYHVKIYSKQTTTYQGASHHLYLRTYEQHFNQDASAETKHVVTGANFPVITDKPATEYMILGTTAHNYKLVTTNLLDGTSDTDVSKHTTVTSVEQYWKTYNMIKQHVLGIDCKNDPTYKDKDSTDPSTFVVPDGLRETLKTKLNAIESGLGDKWHSYSAFAYGVRWNGYNDKNQHNKKAYETLEHWFQTIEMGDGTFDIIEAEIPPVLVLLDNHGWEIMRKPMPTSTSDRAEKLAAIRAYNSPMVKAYTYYTSVSKAMGHHKYYKLSKPVAISGTTYTTTDLGNLPPSTATNVLDSYGAQNDLFVTYTVKDEYADSYSYTVKADTTKNASGTITDITITETIIPSKFIVRQGNYYASDESGTLTANNIPSGGLSKEIVRVNGSFDDRFLWYVQPNNSIDDEMGIVWSSTYENAGEPFTKAETQASYAKKSGFDPYNIQLKNASTGNFFTTNATAATLTEGALVGTGSSTVSLESAVSTTSPKFTMGNYHDHSQPKVTNQTFMAVQDANGNMQLMPRFDHTVRVDNFSTLAAPATAAADDEAGSQTTFLVRPLVYEYIIVDNQGRDALHYKTGGEYYPAIPSHFQSPQASDYAYYKTLTSTGTGTYNLETLDDEITGSFAAAGLSDNTNTVYVRYIYNPVGDMYHYYTLEGAWYTLQLNNKWMKYDDGIKLGADASKPTTETDPTLNNSHAWQWKFRQTPYTDMDPYAVELYNRSYNASNRTSPLPESTHRFALLLHPTEGYALVKCGTQSTTEYQFLNGASMSTSVNASIATEAGFNTYSSTISAGSQLLLTDEITPNYTYHVYTNGTNGDNDVKYGIEAISGTQTWEEAANNSWKPYLPETIQTPLLSTDDYLYYEAEADMGNSAKEIETLYGLYNDNVYVRYNAYNPGDENYLVPNKRNTPLSSEIAVDAASNPSPININGELVYNIFWKTNNMMQSTDDTNITAVTDHDLDGGTSFVWTFEGDDPYAIQIKHQKANKYVDGTGTLNATAQNFMLLKKDGYEYGVLQVTGGSNMLSGYGNSLVESNPTEFIIFALATHKVLYHLVIKNINGTEEIPFYNTETSTLTTKDIAGSTMRDLTNYPFSDVDAGQVSLGAKFDTPTSSAIYRPNCHYDYYIEGIYDEAGTVAQDDLNALYKGHKLTEMPSNSSLIGKTVKVNVVYKFDTSLVGSNKGGDFVKTVDKYWYTFDAKGSGSTVYLAQYTNAWGLQGQEGRSSRYTNDYLWTPLGDPYGFTMHNRYVHKNGGNTDYVMTTKADAIDDGVSLFVGKPGTTVTVSGSTFTPAVGNEIFELLAAPTLGYFYVHPVKNNAGTKYYVTRNASDGYLKLTTSGSQWTFGLDISQLKPYFDRKAYVGGLTSTAYSNNPMLVSAINSGSLTYDQLVATQELVYTDDNIVPYAIGYYRMHAQPDVPSISNVRYASGYLHDIAKTAGEGSTAIPMHFYSRKGVTTVFESATDNNALNAGFTKTDATRGEIPVLATENDPSTIFYFYENEVETNSANSVNAVPTSRMMTQGLYVSGAVMTATEPGTSARYYIMDIGGATLLIHDGQAPELRQYLCFDQSNASSIYDLQFKHDCPTDDAKWCMEPVNNQGLIMSLNNGGDGHYYATFCAPFDALLPTTDDRAYVCEHWNTTLIHPIPVGKVNTGDYADNDQFIPAGTPVIIRSNNSDDIKLTIPTTTPTTALSCVFSGKYLEQKLATEISDAYKVFTFGLPMTGINLTTDSGDTNGDITGVSGMVRENTGVGFYINATPNKEVNMYRSMWTRNNRYVLHNKIYYWYDSQGASARSMDSDVEFIPVVFDDDEPIEDSLQPVVRADQVFDLSGRCVATGQDVLNGTWRQRVAPGIYIIGGKKVSVR